MPQWSKAWQQFRPLPTGAGAVGGLSAESNDDVRMRGRKSPRASPRLKGPHGKSFEYAVEDLDKGQQPNGNPAEHDSAGEDPQIEEAEEQPAAQTPPKDTTFTIPGSTLSKLSAYEVNGEALTVPAPGRPLRTPPGSNKQPSISLFQAVEYPQTQDETLHAKTTSELKLKGVLKASSRRSRSTSKNSGPLPPTLDQFTVTQPIPHVETSGTPDSSTRTSVASSFPDGRQNTATPRASVSLSKRHTGRHSIFASPQEELTRRVDELEKTVKRFESQQKQMKRQIEELEESERCCVVS
ncbi:hypothetical protein DIPPA_28714 [Diplonema papillatum]|nr:hypothetical protein DIPPA_28714 [Diplonema papillatum]